MDRITSRKNAVITHLRALGAESAYRAASGEYLCDGYKLLDEAVKSGAAITSILWKEGGARAEIACDRQYSAPPELFDYASPMKNSPGPLFSVRRGVWGTSDPVRSAIVLENVQDPGNVGTIWRTADAAGFQAVLLGAGCADPLSPKVQRAAMGSGFRVPFMIEDALPDALLRMKAGGWTVMASDLHGMDFYGRPNPGNRYVLVIGNEARGISQGTRLVADMLLKLPMRGGAESLNAAVAAGIMMYGLTEDR